MAAPVCSHKSRPGNHCPAIARGLLLLQVPPYSGICFLSDANEAISMVSHGIMRLRAAFMALLACPNISVRVKVHPILADARAFIHHTLQAFVLALNPVLEFYRVPINPFHYSTPLARRRYAATSAGRCGH